jgi:glycosyltransferase involved in cell wall biosynthesis
MKLQGKFEGDWQGVSMPAYNEERSVAKMVLLCRKYVDLVVVVDGGSVDLTVDIAQAMGAHVIRNPDNIGYARALQTCFKTARDLAADRIVIIDSGGQHDPARIPELLASLNEDFDVVIGSESINGNGKNVPGLRAYGKKAIENININANNMSADSEILIQINDHHLKIKEVEVQCDYDVNYQTENPVRHGLKVLVNVIHDMEFNKPLYYFSLPGAVIGIIGLGMGLSFLQSFYHGGTLKFGPTLLMILLTLVGTFMVFTGILLHTMSRLILENRKEVSSSYTMVTLCVMKSYVLQTVFWRPV